MKKPLKIGAYIRVSTDKQVQVFEGSLETQEFRMREFIKNRNREHRAWGELVEVYAEEGFSAGTDKRPQYQRMMSDVRSGKINLILVSDISRLSRSVHDFSILLRELEQHGASYLSMKEQFDTTTPAGRLMINMVVNMAQFEREQTSERVSINFNARARRGYVNGGRAGLGFERDQERRGVLLCNEVEAEQVRTIFKLFLEHGSVGKTIPAIEALGILPKASAANTEDNSTRRWSHSLLRDVLTNLAYLGLKEVNKKNKHIDPDMLKPWELYEVVKASWPAIVQESVFNEVQNVLEENLKSERRRLASAKNRIFLLSGILHCGECGRPLCGQSAHGKVNVHRYYGHSYKRGQAHKCSRKRIRADELEQVVLNHFSSVATRAGYFDEIEQKISTLMKESPRQIEEAIDVARRRLREIESEVTAAFRMQTQVRRGTDAAEITAEHLENLGRQKKALVNRLAELECVEANQKEPSDVRHLIRASAD